MAGGTAALPVPAFSLAMLAATPIEGTHYLSDMLAGLVVALVAIGLEYFVHDFAAQGASSRVPSLNPANERSSAPS